MRTLGLLGLYGLLVVVGLGLTVGGTFAAARFAPTLEPFILLGGLVLSTIAACWPAVWISYWITPESDPERAFQAAAAKTSRSMRPAKA